MTNLEYVIKAVELSEDYSEEVVNALKVITDKEDEEVFTIDEYVFRIYTAEDLNYLIAEYTEEICKDNIRQLKNVLMHNYLDNFLDYINFEDYKIDFAYDLDFEDYMSEFAFIKELDGKFVFRDNE